jgi:hypothetical protein
MLAIQEKKLKEAIAILSLVGAKYKVITPDGAEYGDLEVKVLRPETTKNGLPRYKFGETRNFFRDDISTMKAGDVKVIDCKNYDCRVIARDISSYGCQNFGTKSVSTLADREANTVEVFALKDLG